MRLCVSIRHCPLFLDPSIKSFLNCHSTYYKRVIRINLVCPFSCCILVLTFLNRICYTSWSTSFDYLLNLSKTVSTSFLRIVFITNYRMYGKTYFSAFMQIATNITEQKIRTGLYNVCLITLKRENILCVFQTKMK